MGLDETGAIRGILSARFLKRDNVNVHRAAANSLQAEKTARPAAPVQRIVQVSRYRGVVFNHDCSQCW